MELKLYQAYLYGAEKIPETADPRASLRPLFETKMSDSLIKFAQSNGVQPKVYDARGDGLTNTGKGGVLKGCKVLLDGWKKMGLMQDYTLARRAIQGAITALRAVDFNSRDYYVQGPAAWPAAVQQRQNVYEHLSAAFDAVREHEIRCSQFIK